MKDLNNDWLATQKSKAELKKQERNKKITLGWGIFKGLVRTGYYICKIIEFFDASSGSD